MARSLKQIEKDMVKHACEATGFEDLESMPVFNDAGQPVESMKDKKAALKRAAKAMRKKEIEAEAAQVAAEEASAT